jgi:hypothetical protein
MGGALGYLAMSNAGVLRRIEQNTVLAFLYQSSFIGLCDKRVIYLEGSRCGFDSAFGEFIAKYPFLKGCIEHVSGESESAQRLIELASEPACGKRLVVVHGIEWLSQENVKKWLEKLASDPPSQSASAPAQEQKSAPSGGTVSGSDLLANALALARAKGIDLAGKDFSKISGASVNLGALSGAVTKPVLEKKERPRLTATGIKDAFSELYLRGSEREIFMLCTAESYKAAKSVVLSLDSALEKQLASNTVYGSFDEKTNEAADPYSVANTAYVTSEALTVRLYDYSRGADEWWDALKERIKGE